MNTPQFHPDVRDEDDQLPGTTGLFCFLDKERPCGSECMAFLSDAPDQDDYRGQQWSHCHLLVNAHRGGKHLVVLASTAGELVRAQKTAAADQRRLAQPPPPPVVK